MEFIPSMHGWFNRMKNKNHMILSIDTETEFDEIQYHFMLKVLSKIGIGGTFHNTIKAIYDKPNVSIILNMERLETFPLRSGIRI